MPHIADSLTAAQDANGAVLQGIFMGTCSQLNFFEGSLQISSEPIGVILDLLNLPPLAELPGVTPVPGVSQVICPSN